MPPRFAYWTLLIDGAATAFRARDHEDLLPTLNQLRRRHKEVTLRYFARGKLWDSPEQAQWAAAQARQTRSSRGPEWRPGAAQKDPRTPSGKARPKAPRTDRIDRAVHGRGPTSSTGSRSPQRPDNRGFRDGGSHQQRNGGPKARRPWAPQSKGHAGQQVTQTGRGPQRHDKSGPQPATGRGGKFAKGQRPSNPKTGAGRRPWSPKGGAAPKGPHAPHHQGGPRQGNRSRRTDFGKGRGAPVAARQASVTTGPEDLDRAGRAGSGPSGSPPKVPDSDR